MAVEVENPVAVRSCACDTLIVHSRSKLVHFYSLLYHDITGHEYGDLGLGECGTSNKSHENRVPVRIESATPPAG